MSDEYLKKYGGLKKKKTHLKKSSHLIPLKNEKNSSWEMETSDKNIPKLIFSISNKILTGTHSLRWDNHLATDQEVEGFEQSL